MNNSGLPRDLLKELKEIESKREEEREREKIKEKEKRKIREERRREIEVRIKSKKHIKLVNLIINWCYDFRLCPEKIRLMDICKRINILHAKFFNGEPIPKENVTCWTTITLDKSKGGTHLICTEYHKSSPTKIMDVDISLLFSYTRDNIIDEILRSIHPMLIETLAETIKIGKVYEFIKKSMPKE